MSAKIEDGWHVVPGDGKLGDPSCRAWRPEPQREFFWAYIAGGKVLGISIGDVGNVLTPKEFSDAVGDYTGNKELLRDCEAIWGCKTIDLFNAPLGKIEGESLTGFEIMNEKRRSLMSSKLADGWYRVPGDGLAGDPGRHYNAWTAQRPGISRFYHWVKIIDGKISTLMAWLDASSAPECDLEYFGDLGYFQAFEKIHGGNLLEVIQDHYGAPAETSLAKTALAAGGVAAAVGLLKELFKKRKVGVVKSLQTKEVVHEQNRST